MKKRVITLVITFVFLLCCLPVSADKIFDFNKASFWHGGEFTKDGIIVSNPVDSSQEEGVYHLLDFTSKIPLYKNTMYTLSFEICANMDSSSTISARASFSYAHNDILMTVSGISTENHHISVPFASGSEGYFGLCFYLLGESEETTFNVKNITLTEGSYKPISMNVSGKSNLYIPETGYISYPYYAITTDYQNFALSLLDGKIQVEGELPQGVSFNSSTFAVTVTPDAFEGDSFYLKAYPSDGSNLTSNIFKVTLTKNLISNGDFENSTDDMWDLSNVSIQNEDSNNFVLLNTIPLGAETYTASLTSNYNYYLTSGSLYTLRAKVKSSKDFVSSTPVVSSFFDGTAVSFNISDIGTENWQEIICGFVPQSSGIYDLVLNFESSDSRPVFVDDISFSADTLKPSKILFSLPKHISAPTSDYLYMPILMQSVDQLSNPVSDIPVASVFPDNTGVSVSDNTLIVSSWASEGVYLIKAETPSGAKGTYNLIINKKSIGGGDFEHSTFDNYWITAPPSVFSINSFYNGTKPKEGSCFGILYMNGNVSALLSSSVGRYDKGKSYVFNADVFKNYSDIDTMVTVLIAGTQSSSFEESIVVGQFLLSSEYSTVTRVFTPSESVTGRLMIAFNTPEEHDSQVILLDNIKITPAEVNAQSVFIYGSPFVERMVSGTYSFSSNFGGTDASTFRWLVSTDKNGVFLPISGETSDELSVTENLNGKYIKFEVTPVSLEGPVSGASATSPAIEIGKQIPDYSSYVPDTITPTPEETPHPPSLDETDKIPSEIYLNPVDLFYFEQFTDSIYYFDMVGHWAENDVKLMSSAGITNGRNDQLFFPNDYITRAEFSAFLIRSFNLAPLYYTGNFSDVKQWQWYSGVVETVYKYQLAQGLGNGIFGPELPLTREQMAVMIMRAYKKSGASIPENSQDVNFNDNTKISVWAKEAINNAVALGILIGNEDNTFAPARYASRAETLTAIKRMIITIYQNTSKNSHNNI